MSKELKIDRNNIGLESGFLAIPFAEQDDFHWKQVARFANEQLADGFIADMEGRYPDCYTLVKGPLVDTKISEPGNMVFHERGIAVWSADRALQRENK